MKKSIIAFVAVCCLHLPVVYGQLTVEVCQQKAQANYPEIKQLGLISQSTTFTLSNANKGYLPQFSLSAKATYQSDVTKIPISIPNINIHSLSKDQYQTTVAMSQLIWDGGAIHARKGVIRASSNVDQQKVKVDLYDLNDRVNQLFFGILSLNEQLRQNKSLENELQAEYSKIEAYLHNGVANQADLDNIHVELLNAGQQRITLQTVRNSYVAMLSAMIGTTVNPEQIAMPSLPDSITGTLVNKRPELSLFSAENQLYNSQRKNIYADNLPKINFFIQGGYGRPGLNMLDNSFKPYYIGGIQLSWNFGNLYTLKNNLRTIDLNQKIVASQRETFLFNSRLTEMQQSDQITQWQKLIRNDDEIIRLRNAVKLAADAKVANGTLSVTDLITDITAEHQARIDKALHQVQLLLSIYNLKYTTNN